MMNRGMRGSGGLTGATYGGGAGRFGSTNSPANNNSVSQAEAEKLMEEQNDRHLEQLAGLVSGLKETVIEIQSTADEQNRFLDRVMKSMGGANHAVKGTINRLDEVMKKGGSKHLCALAAFSFFVLLTLYYLLKFK